jgi:hypothetical protein
VIRAVEVQIIITATPVEAHITTVMTTVAVEAHIIITTIIMATTADRA